MKVAMSGAATQVKYFREAMPIIKKFCLIFENALIEIFVIIENALINLNLSLQNS